MERFSLIIANPARKVTALSYALAGFFYCNHITHRSIIPKPIYLRGIQTNFPKRDPNTITPWWYKLGPQLL